MAYSLGLETIDWQGFQQPRHVSVGLMDFDTKTLRGDFYISKRGFVYGATSRPIVWIKFLGLGLYLPLCSTIAKCAVLAKQCFSSPTDGKGFHHISHSFGLAKIAWQAVIGANPLFDRVEAFSLKELEYNNKSVRTLLENTKDSKSFDEMQKPRSKRFEEGFYVAKCMQPLFHIGEAAEPISTLKGKISNLYKTSSQLDNAIGYAKNKGSWTATLTSFFVSNPFYSSSLETLMQEKANVEKELNKLQMQLNRAERCRHYATRAILQQNPCSSVSEQAARLIPSEVVDECRCNDVVCYKREQICGCIHKIDCCATRCWAIDCGCCCCCFWPEGRSWCLIS